MAILKRILIFSAILFYFGYVKAEILKIADFDDGHKPNLINGDYGAWDKDGNDPTQFCVESFDRSHPFAGKGCSLQLDYDIDSPNKPAYNGFWMRLERIDLSEWKYLIFYIRGDEKIGFPKKIKAEIKNIKQEIASFLIAGIEGHWKKVIIPLDEINRDGDFTEAYEFTLVFDEKICDVKIGRIYIDEFYLSR